MKVWEFILIVTCFVMVSSMLWAATFTTSTGQGYFTWNGQVISYYNFTPGANFNLVNGVTATDTIGTPNATINEQAFNSYICSQTPSNPGC